jgi:hypothetical protein
MDLQHTYSAALGPLVALGVVTFLARQFRAWYRLRHVPGPFWCSVSVFPMLGRAWSGKYHEELKKLGDKYGLKHSPSITSR